MSQKKKLHHRGLSSPICIRMELIHPLQVLNVMHDVVCLAADVWCAPLHYMVLAQDFWTSSSFCALSRVPPLTWNVKMVNWVNWPCVWVDPCRSVMYEGKTCTVCLGIGQVFIFVHSSNWTYWLLKLSSKTETETDLCCDVFFRDKLWSPFWSYGLLQQ